MVIRLENFKYSYFAKIGFIINTFYVNNHYFQLLLIKILIRSHLQFSPRRPVIYRSYWQGTTISAGKIKYLSFASKYPRKADAFSQGRIEKRRETLYKSRSAKAKLQNHYMPHEKYVPKTVNVNTFRHPSTANYTAVHKLITTVISRLFSLDFSLFLRTLCPIYRLSRDSRFADTLFCLIK